MVACVLRDNMMFRRISVKSGNTFVQQNRKLVYKCLQILRTSVGTSSKTARREFYFTQAGPSRGEKMFSSTFADFSQGMTTTFGLLLHPREKSVLPNTCCRVAGDVLSGAVFAEKMAYQTGLWPLLNFIRALINLCPTPMNE